MTQIISLLAFLFVGIFPATVIDDQKPISAEDILQKTAAKLAALKTVKYKYYQEYNYKSEAYFAESRAESFLDFTPAESSVGLRFQFDTPNLFIAYNGSEYFLLNKKDKTIRVESKPTDERLSASSQLQFALPMWRNILPKILADKSIVKYIRDAGMNNYVVEFELDKAYIESGLGTKILPITLERKNIYRLTIDNKTFLPTEIYRGNNVNQDFNKTVFSEVVENPAAPPENSWYYSTYLKEYKYAEPPEEKLIKAGEAAHAIGLPLFGEEKNVSLSDYRGKVVLLAFWIVHCGASQNSVPKLNALQAKYKNHNFKLFTVNIADSEKQISLFIEKTKPEFPILYQGEAVAKKYGVWYYPTAVLLGQDGKVLYSGELDEAKIDALIKKNL